MGENEPWRSHYLDYKALKQILSQLAQVEAQVEEGAKV